MNNPTSHPNLKPFPPGVSGNPAGKRKGTRNFSTVLNKLLDDPKFIDKVLEKKPGWWSTLSSKTARDAIAAAMTIKAMNGDSAAANWVAKNTDGIKLLVGGDPENPLPNNTALNVDQVMELSQNFAKFMMKETKPKKKPDAKKPTA